LLHFIANRLRELRLKHGLTQEQMALLLKTDLRWYQRVEIGEKDIRATTIDRLGAVFGISGTEFLWRKIPRTRIVAKIYPAPHRPRETPKPVQKPKHAPKLKKRPSSASARRKRRQRK
jgi:transcriptional regulator with XRE-family HTH domain